MMKNLHLTLLKAYMIKIIKIITGEEIIGEVSENSDTITIKKPCILQIIPSRSNPEQPAMGLFPYASYVDNHSITLKNQDIIWKEDPVKELYNQYNSVFGNGLVVSSKF